MAGPCVFQLTWWQLHHPSWVLYSRDRTTPSFAYGDCNVPLDITNPEVVLATAHAVHLPQCSNLAGFVSLGKGSGCQ